MIPMREGTGGCQINIRQEGVVLRMTTRPVIVMVEEIETIDPEETVIEGEVAGEIPGEVHLGMMIRTILIDLPTAEGVVDVEENATH